MDVRDAMKAGKTTAIVSTGGIEPNGPWLALGKHNYVLRANCDAIARKLGNALCAPIIALVPEGAVAETLNAQWNGNPVVAHIPEYYDYASVHAMLREGGFMPKEATKSDGLHDDPGIALNMFITDPKSIRFEQRVKAGKATIDGVSLADKAKSTEWAKKIVEFRATKTVAAIQKAIASKGKAATSQE
jgi:hypothetical protein